MNSLYGSRSSYARRMRKSAFAAMLLALAFLLSACAASTPDLHDGYYSAEQATFSEYGWKEYITIYVSGGRIVTVEYDARNASGFIRSWDMDYMRTMRVTDGTYPNEYSRTYRVMLLNWQDPFQVDAITGATGSHTIFQLLAEAAIAQARAGDKQVALVEVPISEEEASEDGISGESPIMAQNPWLLATKDGKP